MSLPNLTRLSLNHENQEEASTGAPRSWQSAKKAIEKSKSSAKKYTHSPAFNAKKLREMGARVSKRIVGRVRQKIVQDKRIVYNIVFNNCVDYALTIFGHVATCTIGMTIQDPNFCKVKPGTPENMAYTIDEAENRRLIKMFTETAGDNSYIQGFEELYYFLLMYPEIPFNVSLIQIRHNYYKPKEGDPVGNAQKYLAYKRGHVMVGVELNYILMQDEDDKLQVYGTKKPYGFCFGASPDDAWIFDGDKQQQFPKRGLFGLRQQAMLRNRQSVKAVDMLPEAIGKDPRKNLTFKVTAPYNPEDEMTYMTRNNLLDSLASIVAMTSEPYAGYDCSDYKGHNQRFWRVGDPDAPATSAPPPETGMPWVLEAPPEIALACMGIVVGEEGEEGEAAE